MGPYIVVPEAEEGERIVKLGQGIDFPLIQFLFQRSKKSLDLPVLPGAVHVNGVMPNAEQF